jgi:hypothetical protein
MNRSTRPDIYIHRQTSLTIVNPVSFLTKAKSLYEFLLLNNLALGFTLTILKIFDI